ncbi:MAG: hypothetical protein K6T16_00145 [Candidatus Pacearchaeota archaeon]|nr:hypothetical protein [Candidatus Pacearchaeota archaeon]
MRIKPTDSEILGRKAKRPRERPLYWNFIGNPNEEKTIYYFLIVNTDKRQIEDISGILYGQMPRPIEARQKDGKLQDLHYRVFIVDTHNTRIDLYKLKRAYNGEIEKDTKLYEGKSPDRLEKYVVSKLEKILGLSS